jgi:hypothetical protein
LHKFWNLPPGHGWVVFSAYCFSRLLRKQMLNYVNGVRLAIAVPAPGNHGMDALLNSAGGLGLGKPDGLQHLGNIAGLDFV